ncbi:MAG: hypothetical protein QJR03_05645 [Sphaerobacter sp.]|nr:hypothetical protein [Sphaerobacter sp.]
MIIANAIGDGMILKGHGTLAPQSLSEELLRQRAILLQQEELLAALRARVADFERRFALPSDRVHEAIEDGSLVETEEICDWIIDDESLRAASAARRPPRLE